MLNDCYNISPQCKPCHSFHLPYNRLFGHSIVGKTSSRELLIKSGGGVVQRLQYNTYNAKNPSTICVTSIVKAALFKKLVDF